MSKSKANHKHKNTINRYAGRSCRFFPSPFPPRDAVRAEIPFSWRFRWGAAERPAGTPRPFIKTSAAAGGGLRWRVALAAVVFSRGCCGRRKFGPLVWHGRALRGFVVAGALAGKSPLVFCNSNRRITSFQFAAAARPAARSRFLVSC